MALSGYLAHHAATNIRTGSGILDLGFGVLGFFGLAGSAAILLGMNSDNPMNRILEESDFYRVYPWASFVLGLVATTMLPAAGGGLIASKAWARTLSVGYAIYAIVMGLVGQVVRGVFLMGPLLRRASEGGGPETVGAAAGAMGGTVGGCVGLAYPVVLLVFMFRRNVVEYFTTVSGGAAAGG